NRQAGHLDDSKTFNLLHTLLQHSASTLPLAISPAKEEFMLSPHRFDRFATKMIAITFCALLFVASLAYGSEHPTSTPIKHVVVIFQENVSFDHYFATYPVALNTPGEPQFHARRGTPTVNGLSGALLAHNPNLVNPFRFSRSQ